MTRSPLFARLRVTVGIATAALLAGSLAACGGGSGDSKSASGDATEITILSSFTTGNVTGDTLKKLSDEFTKQTNIKITIEQANTNDIAGNYEASKLANKERDL